MQKLSANVERNKIEEEISEKIDILKFCSTSNIIRIADLGSAAGPNTFIAMQNVIKAIVEKYQSLSPTSPLPEFQVFFNDQASNDFNTLFLTLPPESNTLQLVWQVLFITGYSPSPLSILCIPLIHSIGSQSYLKSCMTRTLRHGTREEFTTQVPLKKYIRLIQLNLLRTWKTF